MTTDTDQREAQCLAAVRALDRDDLREAFEYCTNTDPVGMKRTAIVKRVVQGVLDCEVSVAGFDAYAKPEKVHD
jgi:hypothetical protein